MINQFNLVSAIMNELARQVDGISVDEVDMNTIIRAADAIKASTDAKLATKESTGT